VGSVADAFEELAVSTDVERDAMAASTKEAKSRCGAAADICLFLDKKWEGVLCRTLRP
jgi:hypothetical protein